MSRQGETRAIALTVAKQHGRETPSVFDWEEAQNLHRQFEAVMAASAPQQPGLREAWDRGFTAACKQWTTQRDDPSHPITRTNPYVEEG